MVSVVHTLSDAGSGVELRDRLADDLTQTARSRVLDALDLATELYADRKLGTGEDVLSHAVGMATQMASLKLDADSRLAALLFLQLTV